MPGKLCSCLHALTCTLMYSSGEPEPWNQPLRIILPDKTNAEMNKSSRVTVSPGRREWKMGAPWLMESVSTLCRDCDTFHQIFKTEENYDHHLTLSTIDPTNFWNCVSYKTVTIRRDVWAMHDPRLLYERLRRVRFDRPHRVTRPGSPCKTHSEPHPTRRMQRTSLRQPQSVTALFTQA